MQVVFSVYSKSRSAECVEGALFDQFALCRPLSRVSENSIMSVRGGSYTSASQADQREGMEISQ